MPQGVHQHERQRLGPHMLLTSPHSALYAAQGHKLSKCMYQRASMQDMDQQTLTQDTTEAQTATLHETGAGLLKT